ncbi:MAG: DUF2309 domain-containing protein [Rhodocyclaceae bacterium]
MHPADDNSSSLHERVAAWVRHLEHVLPAQAPIRNFVHHNTLHGLQHLTFPAALAEAARISGARPWLDEVQSRALHAAGRIDDSDLNAALDELRLDGGAGLAGLDECLPGFPALRRRDVLRALLTHDTCPPGPAKQQWLQDEGRLDTALWAACACLEEIPATAAGAVDGALASLLEAIYPQTPQVAAWQQEARMLWSALVARVGSEWTLSSLLLRLTGENVFDTVRPLLIRHLSSHLDLGMAAWHNPARGQGFYAAWRQSAGVDLGWELDELVAARDEIAALPTDPVETIGRELMHLGPSEAHWGDYLERLALELPGWSGMFLWRDQHPQYAGSDVPVAMADYLAVRLVLERLHCEDLVRRTWALPLFLSELGDHFLAHPAELWVRHAFFAGLLEEAPASEAQRLIAAEQAADAEWQRLANAAARTPVVSKNARWSCYLLAQALALSPAALQAAGREGADALLAETRRLDSHQRGYVWLLAYERHYRQQIFAALAANHGRSRENQAPAAQLVFCMDDREEGTRRHLEEINPAVETFGAAGFFGVPMYWRGMDDTMPTALCPVVVTPANEVCEHADDAAGLALHQRRRALRLAWKERLHRATRDSLLAGPLMTLLGAPLAAGAMALQTLAPAWLGERLERWRSAFDQSPATHAAVSVPADGAAKEPAGTSPRAGFSDSEQIERVAGFLRSIGLTERFAPLIVIVGHGSNSANNPHLAAYDCGACSGRHGGPNARVFAVMANRPEIRAGVAAHGIVIPDATWFLGAEHNTGDESITWYDTAVLPPTHQAAFASLCKDFDEATQRHAIERCRRFASAPHNPSADDARRHLVGRRHDWSQARPELGHATVAVAFIGRRSMSRGAFFDRRSFLISYDPLADAAGHVLEATLLAAGPVGAGIALEYYFSTVDNERFGCGTKIMHNLAGLMGVMEGASSDLRTGLPRQMIEIHEAMRLLVVIEQTREVVTAIYARQPPLRELIGNGWIIVAVKEPESGAIHRFDPAAGWLPWRPDDGAASSAVPGVPVAANSAAWLGAHREPLPPALLEVPA